MPQKNRPQQPDWIVELGIGSGRPPIDVHMGGCYAAGKRRRPVPRDEHGSTSSPHKTLASARHSRQPRPRSSSLRQNSPRPRTISLRRAAVCGR
ncbi:DUF6233 domain-containing protein [Streptomyces sp. NBC_00268]|uniref:DUF6233 domain-containing protein n=1 Tax=Streptomyces sp. NBC_01764 TaxID=2975935 RepID=UPI00224DA71C|nr:DUF6233 domain-containing protein [Streptomyces sp. NBC_01764]MCX4404625.1 DUF6233 domain-containing protein [Streptomyces sp. NBC_01764]MCX5190831.1 DUF6233 domain-containing protein [Streptomyces sp. NBC_00268]